MRSSKLIPALAAASALLVLAPAGAGARAAAHKATPKSRCRVSLIAEPRTIVSGESAQVFGQLICLGGSAEGQTVTLYGRTAPATAFKAIGTTSTGAGGFYSFLQSALTSDSFYYVRVLGKRSGTKSVRVAPVVKLEGPDGTTLFTGVKNRVAFKGTVTPADVGAEVLLEREHSTSSEEWNAIQRAFVGPGGTFTLNHAFSIPGDANLRVIVRPHGTAFTVRGVSNTLSDGISQRENPNLTINTTTYTIPYGSPVTISGALKEGAGKPITLLAHTAGKALETVTTMPAGEGGKYSFVQTPLKSTIYQVTGGGQRSANLFQGVKYLLTAGVSAKTVQSGQALTFAGTVTPAPLAPAVKLVYLERENLFGGGFHVADVGVVGADGTYLIAHAFFGAGKQVFRIKVPGDPTNQAASSSSSAIEVTPAPPGALKALAPAKQPH
jgi:hypothetical protein